MNTTKDLLSDQILASATGGMVNPSDAVGMTWDEIHANPEEFNARWEEYQKAHPQFPGILGNSSQRQ